MKKLSVKDRRGGFYWIKEKPYVTVTTVLSVLNKEAILYWYGREIYLAMVQDPSMSQKDAMASPYKTTKSAQERGTTVHAIVEAYEHTKKHITGIHEKYRPYAEAFYDWIEENNMELLQHERTVISEKYKYAGTLDLLAKNKKTGKIYLIDIKTGKNIYPEAFLQLSAYKQALKEEDVKVDKIAVLLLRDTGKYKFEEGEDDIGIFLSCKKLWEWRNKKLCEKVEYNK